MDYIVLMKALILDFDGVIVDSARECFLVALQAYLRERPTSTVVHRKTRELYEPFLELIPLGNRAEDYGTMLKALEEGKSLQGQEAYDEFRNAQDAVWLQKFQAEFYRVRAMMASRDPVSWRDLMRPHRPLLEMLRRQAGKVAYAIATSKDRESVDALLSDFGVADLFPAQLILDKEAGVSKTAHLTRLQEVLEMDPAEMTFVDDKVNHLDAVAPLGVRCGLATWGYNGSREHELAVRRRYLMLTLDNVESKLFGE
jgi:phosphoglycolate phosphatase-like HAD superfamily hydrolase